MTTPDLNAVVLPPLPEPETYCLACDKVGHLTTECHSTHGINTPAARELNRLCRAAVLVDRNRSIDMVLHCPACGLQHIDKPEGQFYPGMTAEESAAQNDALKLWNNPPHRSHLCHGCGHIWRPADVPTNGVDAVKTTGKADSSVLADRERQGDDTKRLEWLAQWAGNPRVVQVLVCTVRNDLISLRTAIDAAIPASVGVIAFKPVKP